jgi:L-malate glycosyltransferase
MPKICIVTPEYPPLQWGGLARTVGKTACRLRDLGLDVHVAHFMIGDDGFVCLDENRETFERDGITIHAIRLAREPVSDAGRELWDCPHNLTLQMMYQSLEKLHYDESFELLHSFFLYPVGYITGLLAKRMRLPSVVTLVGNDVKRYIFSPEKTAVCRSGLENADRVVALSEDLMEMADALTTIRQKTYIIYNSVEIPEARRKKPGRVFKIGCAGIFKYAKGLPYILKAVAAPPLRNSVNLELVGHIRPSESAMFNHMMNRTGINEILTVVDPIPHDRMNEWFNTLDVFVLPSLTEGCPNVLMEAMAAGVPCIATTTGANTVLIENGVSGLLIPWGDTAALSQALRRLLDGPVLAREMGSAGRSRMEAFSPEREKAAWENLYRGLIEF